jgi:hypothetical protein
MDGGAHQEDRSADANHNRLHPLKNAWLQHFDPLSGRPIEIVWAWVTFERIVVLEPITKCMAVQLVLDNWNPHTNCMAD